jgi:hypothetical protein
MDSFKCPLARATIVIIQFGFILAAPAQAAQSPERELTAAEQTWVSESCPRSLGPSLWRSCNDREVAALRSGFPNLSNLPPSDSNWVAQSCPRTLGPSLYRSCVGREVTALREGIPSLRGVGDQDTKWILESCPRSLGPSLFKSCLTRELSAVRR